jgi:hypothetical protein
MGKSVETLIFSKSLALIEKTRRRVEQVDVNEFPTPSSKEPRTILLSALSMLADSSNWPQINAEALYNTLIRLQAIVDEIEASTSAHISWPLVSYCGQLWRELFPDGQQSIFYSVTKAHNYMISSFTGRLRNLLKNVLAQDQINKVCGPKTIYCLQLASLEDENLPLYANIGHEFGHALYWASEVQIKKILIEEMKASFSGIFSQLQQLSLPMTQRDVVRVFVAIQQIAIELFCDAVGAKLVGPAFLLSLHEMSWGANLAQWSIRLAPNGNDSSYPSFQFRVDCLKTWIDVASFAKETEKYFKAVIRNKALKNIGTYVSEIPSDHATDRVSVVPLHEPNAENFRKVFEANLSVLKPALKSFLTRCTNEVLVPRLTSTEFVSPPADVVAQLLHRLESDILPNIMPDGTLLGAPVSLSSMLNAAALYRVHLLQLHGETKETEGVYREIQKVERLTAKALEVSYIQKEFRKWESAKITNEHPK